MANNPKNNAADRKKAQELEAEKPFGDLDHPLNGNDPSVERNPNNPAYDPEGRVMAAEAKSALLDDTEPSTPATYNLGTSATVTQIATSPDAYIIESNGEEFVFTGNVEQFLSEHNITDVTWPDDDNRSSN